jgi:uncharacterized protein (DUF1697 family)
MNIYIALLRGINVSGKNKISMVDLKNYLTELDFKNIATYIQSGNIVFKASESDLSVIAQGIKNKIAEKYGFDVPVMVKQPKDLQHIIENNPFLKDASNDVKSMHITFLGNRPTQEKINHLATYQYPSEQYVLENQDIYFYAPNGYGKAKMTNNFFENKLKVPATTRNWQTVNVLFEMVKKMK